MLVNQEEGAVLWYCSAGKDRVGVGTALLLEALGVPEETIFRDYLLVNELAGDLTEAQIRKLGDRIADRGLYSRGCAWTAITVRKRSGRRHPGKREAIGMAECSYSSVEGRTEQKSA